MKRVIVKLIIVFAFVGLSSLPVHSALTVLGADDGATYGYIYGPKVFTTSGHQLILDDFENITWYDFTRGATTQADAAVFADTLEVLFNSTAWVDWRLPTVAEFQSLRNSGAGSVFENLVAQRYWLTDIGKVFDFLHGDVENESATNYNAMAVTSQVPIPGAVWLLGAGLIGLLGIKRRQK
jgi:hypothetical protein